MEATGISEEQAVNALSVVAKFVIERFPILEGSISLYIKSEIGNIKSAEKDLAFDEPLKLLNN